MPKNSKSFFERLTGNISSHDDEMDEIEEEFEKKVEIENGCDDDSEEGSDCDKEKEKLIEKNDEGWITEDEDMGQLTIDMFQTPSEIVIKAMVAGVKPENLDVSITQDMITIKGHRETSKETDEDNYYYKELYWGGFARSILLPQEVDTENSEANIKEGLLIIKLPKIRKEKTQKLKVKTG
ncbi:MAG: Hsp20/alpha crystallin family protein [Patescibacteria group bacterium]